MGEELVFIDSFDWEFAHGNQLGADPIARWLGLAAVVGSPWPADRPRALGCLTLPNPKRSPEADPPATCMSCLLCLLGKAHRRSTPTKFDNQTHGGG